jgi:membrane protease YdiL (CAAX protease family)
VIRRSARAGEAAAATNGDRSANGRATGRATEPRASDRRLDAALAVGLAAAVPAFAATFRGPRDQFWSRMTSTGLMLGGLALLANPKLRRTHVGPRELALGLTSAAALYGTFKLGDRFARRFVPGGDDQIRAIYSLRELAPRSETALRLVTIIGPAEELFWRGLIQEALMRRYGRWTGAAMAAVAYSGVHVTTGNFTLMGAAGVAGAHWCLLYAAGLPIGALVVSHCAWDVWIFLVQPTGDVTAVAAG